MSHRRGLIRRRIGRVSIYERHGSWHLYYRVDGGAVRRKVGNSEAGAEVEASLLNARLVSSQQRLWVDQGRACSSGGWARLLMNCLPTPGTA